MIPITEEQVEKYRYLYRMEFSEDIGSIEARNELTALVGLIAALVRHLKLRRSKG